ncbi:hypothetical protein BJV78DRAFT_754097 [Lactifluus subvellereus]|nr:hypothetical protein BJV78DRAFT_754097 [Lactifluus subvellereus]
MNDGRSTNAWALGVLVVFALTTRALPPPCHSMRYGEAERASLREWSWSVTPALATRAAANGTAAEGESGSWASRRASVRCGTNRGYPACLRRLRAPTCHLPPPRGRPAFPSSARLFVPLCDLRPGSDSLPHFQRSSNRFPCGR